MYEFETAAPQKEAKATEKQRAGSRSKSKPSSSNTKPYKSKKSPEGGKEASQAKPVSSKLAKRKKQKKASRVDDSSDEDTDISDDDSDQSSSDSSDADADADHDKKSKKSKKSKRSKRDRKSAKGKKKKSNKKSSRDKDTDDSLSVGSSADGEEDDEETSADEDDTSGGSPNLDDRVRVLEDYFKLTIRNNPNPYYPGGGYPPCGMDASKPIVEPPSMPPPGIPIRSFPPRRVPPPGYRPSRPPPSDNHDVSEKTSRRPQFKRVDWVWDTDRYTYKLQDTAKTTADTHFEGYVFHVRRTFDHEGKYRRTFVDIKSKLLRECLQDVIKNVNGVSLVDEIPKLDPNILFLYVEDFRTHLSALKELEPAGETRRERKKNQKRLDDKRKHLKVLIKYIDKDYHDIKNSLEPMLQSGLITFDFLWALWKPGTLVYSPTYGSHETPRVFKVDVAEKHSSMMKGDVYYVEAKYFEFDGRRFGYGSVAEEIPEFKGARKITSLPCYPLIYHKEESELREKLIERGKQFVALAGVHFRAYSGMAFMKRKKGILKFNITNSRIMVDPAIFRRMNPNYYVSSVKSKNCDVVSLTSDASDSESGCGCEESSSEEELEGVGNDDTEHKSKYVVKMFRDENGTQHFIRLRREQLEEEQPEPELEQLPTKDGVVDGEFVQGHDPSKASDNDTANSAQIGEGQTTEDKATGAASETANSGGSKDEEATETKDSTSKTTEEQGSPKTPASSVPDEVKENLKIEFPVLTDEEYLISSPVVLGFSFAEKQWLEFDVGGVKEIKWNDNAWGSLVLEPGTKDLIKALVESRKFSAATTIDDVIQGKGKGLVTVLHGPPGTGKTLTAEGISELLKCPLYMASAGELGTDSRFLEHELQKILDICHTWGAILLLDEADVFLEKRNMQDIHRNALVSIFLRQLEYFQGILFLTTNRVETFDEAFQSRIHIALRYDRLDGKAKRAIFKLFLERIQTHGKIKIKPFSEEEISALAKHDLNGREIKNVMGSAQDLAVSKGEALSVGHVRLVLDVHAKFGRDLKGGSGFEDAMRSYF